jgi:hypothetical protein
MSTFRNIKVKRQVRQQRVNSHRIINGKKY